MAGQFCVVDKFRVVRGKLFGYFKSFLKTFLCLLPFYSDLGVDADII